MKRKHNQIFGSEDQGVEIKDSTLPEVKGLGLFATRDFAKGDVVCKMKGDLMTMFQYKKKYPKGDAIYVCQLRDPERDGYDLMIDCADPNSCYGRYINTLSPAQKKKYRLSPAQKKKYRLSFNVQFEHPSDDHPLTNWFEITAIRKIEKGEELFVDYGPDYRF